MALSNLTLNPPRRGFKNPTLMAYGVKYHFVDQKSKIGVTNWRCSKYNGKKKCDGCMQTILKDGILQVHKSPHGHFDGCEATNFGSMEQNKTNSSKSAKDRAIDTLRRIQRVFLNMTKKHDAKPNEDGQNEFESEEEPTADISSSENVTKYKADGSGKAMKKADSDIDQHTGLREKIPANDVAEKTLKKRSSAKKKSPPKTKKTSKPIEADKNEIESEEEPSMNLKKKVQKGDRSGRALKKVKSTTSSQSEGISKESEIDKQSGLRKIIPAHDIGEKPSKKRSSVKKISSPKQKKRSSKSSGNQNQQTKTKININPCSKQYRRHH